VQQVVAVVLVVRDVGDVGNDERCGGGGGGVCCTTVVLVGRKQQNRFSSNRELFGFRVTTTAHKNIFCINKHNLYKNLAIANRSHVSCAHNTSRASPQNKNYNSNYNNILFLALAALTPTPSRD